MSPRAAKRENVFPFTVLSLPDTHLESLQAGVRVLGETWEQFCPWDTPQIKIPHDLPSSSTETEAETYAERCSTSETALSDPGSVSKSWQGTEQLRSKKSSYFHVS